MEKKYFHQQLNGVKIDLYFPSWITKAVTGIKCNLGGPQQLANLPWHIIVSVAQTPKVYIRKTPDAGNNSKPTIDPRIDF